MPRATTLFLAIALLFIAGCAASQNSLIEESVHQNAVWSVDLIRTLPGQQAAYLRSIEANWASARRLAKERKAILSYQALMAEPDTARGWDVMLMTEYPDSTAWAQREEVFRAIFESPEFVPMETTQPSSELRAFLNAGVVLKTVVAK